MNSLEALKREANTVNECIEVVKRLDKWDAVEVLESRLGTLIEDIDNENYNRDRR